jgi:hypothetical protein
MADPITAAISAVVTYVGSATAAAAAGTATLAQTATVIAVNAAASLALTTATALLAPKVAEVGNPTDWTANPDGPIPFAAGRVGVAGSIVDRVIFGPDNMYQGFVTVLSGAGPITGFSSFTGDDQSVTFDGSGKAVSSQWSGEMWMKTSVGAQPAATLTSPTGLKNNAAMPGLGPLSGKAAYLMILGENSKRTAYPTGEPKPLWVIEGLKLWDPRLDDTFPGGEGDCRLNDPDTWVYDDNPILWALKWALGLWEGPTGKGAPQVDYQVGGIGAKVEGIDVAAFVAAANVADANGWTCAAYPTTDDDKAQVLDGFLQAGGAIYSQSAGRISCIQRAAPRTSIVTISATDTAGPVEFDTAASRINRVNTLRPRYWSAGNRWQMTAIDEVTAETYQTEDGGKRTRGVDFPFVPDAVQCGQLAALQIAHTREGITGTIPLKPHLQRIRPGDAFTITEAGFVLDGLKCLCLNTDYDPATGVHRVTFVSDTDTKYPFALGQSPTAPASPTLTPVDPTFVEPPGSGDWEVVVRPGGIPGFDLEGLVNNATAARVLVDIGYSADGPWSPMYDGPPTTERVELIVQPESTFWVAVSYFNAAGNQSARMVYGPFQSGALIANDTVNLGGRPVSELFPPGIDLGQIAGDQEAQAEILIREIAERWNRVTTEKRAAITREERIEAELIFTRETLELADANAFALIEDVSTASITRDQAQTETRNLQVSALGDSIAAVDMTVGTLATALSAETSQRTAAISSVEGNLASVTSSVNTLATNLAAETDTRNTQYSATQSTLAAYDSRITTAANQGTANATAISGLGVQVGNVEGSVSTIQSAQIDINGRLSLLYGFALNANGRVSGMYAADDGQVSTIDFEFDFFRIWSGSTSVPAFAVTDGQVYIAGNRVATESMVANAVTKGAFAFSGSEVSVGVNVWTPIVSAAMTTGGGDVRIDFGARIDAVNTNGPNGQVFVRFLRDGVSMAQFQLFELLGATTAFIEGSSGPEAGGYVVLNTVLSSYVHPFTVDPAVAPGGHTWTAEIFSTVGATVGQVALITLLETKR